MITMPGKFCAGTSANGSGLTPSGVVAVIAGRNNDDDPGIDRALMALSNGGPGGSPPSDRLITLDAGQPRAASMPMVRSHCRRTGSRRCRRTLPGSSARSLTMVASNATPMVLDAVAGGGRDSADRRAVPAFVAYSAIAGDVAACRIDPAGEFGQSRIDAAVDDADLDAACRWRLHYRRRLHWHSLHSSTPDIRMC